MTPVHKFSAMGSLTTNKIDYPSMLAGNSAFVANAFESIATVTVGSGGASSVTFSSIPSTFAHLQIRGIARSTNASTQSYIALTYNNDTSSNYTEHGISGDGSTVYAFGGTGNPFAIVQRIAGGSSASNMFGSFIIDILDYTNTNKHKTMRQIGGVDLNGSGLVAFYSSILNGSTSAITRLDLKSNLGDLAQYSHFALYGIRSA